ncbi:hypothetical protein GCM10010922_07450 [Microbacterium sorbitolivorans]|nr:hypothetical protein GCM10010922_07450 [Microbacterium sorbitolivorans]
MPEVGLLQAGIPRTRNDAAQRQQIAPVGVHVVDDGGACDHDESSRGRKPLPEPGPDGIHSRYETGPTADQSALDSRHQNPAADTGTQGFPVSSGDTSGDIGRFATPQKQRNPGKSLIFRGFWSG